MKVHNIYIINKFFLLPVLDLVSYCYGVYKKKELEVSRFVFIRYNLNQILAVWKLKSENKSIGTDL